MAKAYYKSDLLRKISVNLVRSCRTENQEGQCGHSRRLNERLPKPASLTYAGYVEAMIFRQWSVDVIVTDGISTGKHRF